MEGNVTERRLSVAVTPLWLDSSNTSVGLSQPTVVAQDSINREVSPCPEPAEDGLPPNKVQIQTPTEVPRILLPPPRHRGVTETFENTEVEELIAMLRETENLEDQGDILQYLVDTQGLDYNTGEYFQLYSNLKRSEVEMIETARFLSLKNNNCIIVNRSIGNFDFFFRSFLVCLSFLLFHR